MDVDASWQLAEKFDLGKQLYRRLVANFEKKYGSLNESDPAP